MSRLWADSLQITINDHPVKFCFCLKTICRDLCFPCNSQPSLPIRIFFVIVELFFNGGECCSAQLFFFPLKDLEHILTT